ncbi:MAG: hypothetical protein ACRD5H_07290 [Nitrososphaerales archaeon]
MSENNPIECKFCGDDIYFDDDHISDSGKKIPLDHVTGEPHDCPEKPRYAAYTPPEPALIDRIEKLELRVKILEGKKE